MELNGPAQRRDEQIAAEKAVIGRFEHRQIAESCCPSWAWVVCHGVLGHCGGSVESAGSMHWHRRARTRTAG